MDGGVMAVGVVDGWVIGVGVAGAVAVEVFAADS